MDPAPVALFVYDRPEHTRRTLETLARNRLAPETDLVVFSDGARDVAGRPRVAAVREVVRAAAGFRSVRVVEREGNRGLAGSILSGVTEVLASSPRVIVLEDDMVTSPGFLEYAKAGLDLYETERDVASIHGYSLPVGVPLPETFFLRGADCWGWATWRDRWEAFETDGRKLLERLAASGLAREFDLDGSYPYRRMLEDQVAGRNDSWAVRWYASNFLAGKLTLHPGRTLVANIGLDGTGTHCPSGGFLVTELRADRVEVRPIPIAEDRAARREYAAYYRSRRPTWGARLRNRLARIRRGGPGSGRGGACPGGGA